SVPPGWSGTVTPSKAECRFNPTSRAYANVAADQTDQDYTVLDPVISGYIIDANGAACEGVVVATDDANGSDVTDSNGYYKFAVPYDWSGTVTPQKLFWFFEPVSRAYSNLIADAANQNYTGIAGIQISGTVVNPGGAGIAGVEVSADNGGRSDTTDGSGFYKLAVLPGWSGAVTPSKPGRTFEPADRSYIDVTAHLTGQDYLSLPLTVRADGTGGFPTIQAAIDAAVVKGKAITVRGATGEPNDCVIDCEGSYTTPHRGFRFVSEEDANSVLEGIRITNGFGPKEIVGSHILSVGGGIYCRNSSPLIQNCTITGNWGNTFGGGIFNHSLSKPIIRNCAILTNSANEGGGICNYYGSSTIEDCNIIQNSGYYRGGGIISYYSDDTAIRNCIVAGNSSHSFGGGIDNFSSSPIVQNCTITENSLSHYNGGGINNYSGSPTIINCTITNNSVSGTGSTSGGGGIHNWRSSPSIKNCIISGNWTLGRGGGIYNRDNASSNTDNCTISDNSANNYGGGIHNDSSSSSSVRNCIVWANQPSQVYGATTVTYSDIEEGYTGVGNMNMDPVFVDDYHVSSNSPCINGGDPNYSAEPNERDIDSEPRVVGAQIDIGADEFATEQAFIFVSENQYSFTALEGRGNPDAHTLQLCNLGLAASLQWTANTNAAWLVVAPSSGSLDYEQSETLTVAPDINGLAGGEYSGQITIEDPQAINSPKIIDVNLTVIGPSLGISQNTFVFEASKETLDPLPQTLTISNLTGGGT
ncbi:MAG: right-handed parallel beta-helix repeat-containing protein, partial [Planctomycetota bacterium]